MATYKTLTLDVETIQGGTLAGAVVYVSYDRTVRLVSGGIIPDPASSGIAVPVTGTASVQVLASDDPDLTTDSAGFGINVRVVWTDGPPWQRRSKSYVAQVHSADAATVNLSGHLATVATSGVTVLQGPAGPTGPTPAVSWSGDQVTVTGSNGSFQGPHLTGPAGATGAQGLPGVNAVANDTATAGYITTGGSATQNALNAAYLTPSSPNVWQAAPSWLGVLVGLYDSTTGRVADGAVDSNGHFLDANMQALGARQGWGGTKSVAWPLTIPGSTSFTDTATNTSARYPVRISFQANKFRVHIRNRNDRDNVTYSGALSITGLWFGKAATDANGVLTGAFTATPTQIQAAFTTASDGSEWVSGWLSQPVTPGATYLLSTGYTCAAQTNHAGIGACWRTSASTDAGVTAPTVTLATTAPLDVWVEYAAPASTPIVAVLGDSLAAGTNATLPLYDSWPAKWALANGCAIAPFIAHGSTMGIWSASSGSSTLWTKYGGTAKPAFCLWALGANDAFDATVTTLATLQSRYQTLLPLVQSRISPQIVMCTLLPRKSPAANLTQGNANTVAWNTWVEGLPGNFIQYADTYAAVVDTSTGLMRSDIASPDGVHLDTPGYAAVARAVATVIGAPLPAGGTI